MSLPRLALIQDELFAKHRAPGEHPERPERLEAVLSAFSDVACELTAIPARDASLTELARAHTDEYLERLGGCAGKQGFLDPDTYFSEWSHAAAVRAAGGCVRGVDALLDAECDYFFAAVRPPGHHACSDRAMGFCLLNNVAVAAAHALHRLTQRFETGKLPAAPKLMIFDWDVHHGNGTEEIFYESSQVYYISTHQSPHYPGTGAEHDRGQGPGLGFTLNLPMPAGSGDAEFDAVMRERVIPTLEAFQPDLLLVSAGYDAHVRDPLAALRLTDSGYSMMTEYLLSALPNRGRGRVGFVLEGGYDLAGLTGGVRATLGPLCLANAE